MTVEAADITVGLLLAGMGNKPGGPIYAVCRCGDEPPECPQTDRVRARHRPAGHCGGRQRQNNPMRPTDTPTDVADEARAKGMNPKMLCSFTDGSKTQLGCACSATPPATRSTPGMHGVACSVDELAEAGARGRRRRDEHRGPVRRIRHRQRGTWRVRSPNRPTTWSPMSLITSSSGRPLLRAVPALPPGVHRGEPVDRRGHHRRPPTFHPIG